MAKRTATKKTSKKKTAKSKKRQPAPRKKAASKSKASTKKGKKKSRAGVKKVAKAKPAKKKTPAKKSKPPAKAKASAAHKPPLDKRKLRRQLLRKQAELLQAFLNTKGDSRSRETDGTEDYIDYAVSSYDREFLLSLSELERNQLSLVEAALKRLEDREFGLCTNCETPIPARRLEVQPWARYCLKCQELADSGMIDGDLSGDDDDLADADDAGQPEAQISE